MAITILVILIVVNLGIYYLIGLKTVDYRMIEDLKKLTAHLTELNNEIKKFRPREIQDQKSIKMMVDRVLEMKKVMEALEKVPLTENDILESHFQAFKIQYTKVTSKLDEILTAPVE